MGAALLLSISSGAVRAQDRLFVPRETKSCSHTHVKSFSAPQASVLAQNPSLQYWQPLSYALQFDLYGVLSGKSAEVPGVMVLQARRISIGSQEAVFDIRDLAIDSCFVDGQKVSFTVGEDYLTVPAVGDEISVAVYYRARADRERGFYSYDDPSGGRLVYTQSQPNDARSWFPCFDSPGAKAVFSTAIRVPVEGGYTAASNGDLMDKVVDGDTAMTWRYSHSALMAPYLAVVNAGRFSTYTQEYVDTVGARDMTFVHYMPKSIYGSGDPQRWRGLVDHPAMMQVFENRFGTYPFDSYGTVAVSPYDFGGMEHQTLSTLSFSAVEENYGIISAHELGHQWWGNYVTCSAWDDLWLNEGGATFSEMVWLESVIGVGRTIRYYRDMFFRFYNGVPVYPASANNLFNYSTTYLRAGHIYRMLRHFVGEDVFYPLLRRWLEEKKFGAATTEEFISFWERNAPPRPIGIRRFITQWLGVGVPSYRVAWSSVELGGSWRTVIEMNQELEGASGTFHLPLRVQLKFADGRSRFLDLSDTTGSILHEEYSAVAVDSVLVDPASDMLIQNVSYTVFTSAGDISVAAERSLRVAPNPVSDRAVLELRGGVVDGSISVVDLSGRRVYSAVVGSSAGVVRHYFDVAQLSSGAYRVVWTPLAGSPVSAVLIRE